MSVEGIVGIGLAAVGLVVGIIALANVIALRRELRGRATQATGAAPPDGSGPQESGNVFCRNCGVMYDSTQVACPACHAPRG